MAGTILLTPGAPQALKAGKAKPHNTQPSVPRIAEPDEEDDILEFSRELWEENGKPFFSWDEERARKTLQRAFHKKLGLLAVIGRKRHIEAGALLLIDEYGAYSRDFYLNEVFNYVRPDFRRSQHAKTMVSWAIRMSEQLRLLLFMGVLSNHRTVAKIRLYRRIFPEGPNGAFFVYRPKSLAREIAQSS